MGADPLASHMIVMQWFVGDEGEEGASFVQTLSLNHSWPGWSRPICGACAVSISRPPETSRQDGQPVTWPHARPLLLFPLLVRDKSA